MIEEKCYETDLPKFCVIRFSILLKDNGYQTFQMRLLGFLEHTNEQYRKNAGGLI